jgi:polyvinyl alcohol dehydrogenase (cytochrome)
MKVKLFFALILSLSSIAASAKQIDVACGDSVDRHSPVLSNGFGLNLSNTRNQVSDINSANVSGLKLAVSLTAVGSTGKRGAPAVTEQAMFFSSGRDIVAANRHSGCIYWRYSGDKKYAGLDQNHIRSSSVSLINDDPHQPALVVAGDAVGNLYAVNAVTGELVWRKFVGKYPRFHMITGGFQYFEGKLFVPVSSKEFIGAAIPLVLCCRSHGMLQAVDVYSGEIEWTYDATAEPAIDFENFRVGPSGASIWGVPAIDPVRRTVYIGTGQNYSPPVTDTSDAIIALNMDDGSVRWVFQAQREAWNAACVVPAPFNFNCAEPVGDDFDFGAPPVLATTASGRDIVLAADKGGVVYSIDAEDGSLIWANKIGKGSALGGVHWGFARDERRVYVAVADTFVNKISIFNKSLQELLTGQLELPVMPVAGGTPGIKALDIDSGEVVWSITPTHEYAGEMYLSIYSAALTVSNDLLFAGALDGELRAFRTSDGAEVWRYDSDFDFFDVNGNSGSGGTIDSVGAIPAGDTLLLNSGYDNFGTPNMYQAGPGNALFVLKLRE